MTSRRHCSTCGNRLDFCTCVDVLLATAIDETAATFEDLAAAFAATDTTNIDRSTGLHHAGCGAAITATQAQWCVAHQDWTRVGWCVGCGCWVPGEQIIEP